VDGAPGGTSLGITNGSRRSLYLRTWRLTRALAPPSIQLSSDLFPRNSIFVRFLDFFLLLLFFFFFYENCCFSSSFVKTAAFLIIRKIEKIENGQN
jgi:hypothetical protein